MFLKCAIVKGNLGKQVVRIFIVRREQIRKKLKELATLVWKRELDQYIKELAKRFDEWREQKMNCFEINEYIHKFHDGPSRELWKKHRKTASKPIQ